MKHIISGLSLVVLILFLFSCHDEEAGLSPDKGIQNTCTLIANNTVVQMALSSGRKPDS